MSLSDNNGVVPLRKLTDEDERLHLEWSNDKSKKSFC